MQVRNLHEAPPASLRIAIEEINKLHQAANPVVAEGQALPPVAYDMIMPLQPVLMEEVTTWFEELDEADAAKVAELLLLTLQRDKAALTRLQRYMDEGKTGIPVRRPLLQWAGVYPLTKSGTP